MTRSEIEDKIAAIIEPYLEGSSLELVDVEYVREREWFLRIFIDKPGGVGIDDCEQLSRLVEPVLDELDFLKQAYYLEVSSPGLDRVLRKDRDFIRYAGRMVDIKFFQPLAGTKQLTATLKGLFDGKICVSANEVDYSFHPDEVAQIRLHITMGQTKK